MEGNPEIANTFFRAGEIEAWGRGIERMVAACREAGTPKLRIRLETGGLWTEFPFSKAYLKQIEGGRGDAVTDPVTDPVDQVLILLKNEALAPSVMQERLGLKHRPAFRTNYLHPTLGQGLIEMTLPDKPSSRLQKYRLTEAGRARLAALGKER